MALPSFDGDTLVCPVGSSDSNDWKPALAYPPFRSALLAPAAQPAPEPPPPPPRSAESEPCPQCSGRNPEGARFCNACGARMDGTIKPPEPVPSPAFSVPVEPVAELPAPFVPPVVETAPIAAQPLVDAATRRKTMIAAFVIAVAAGGGLGWRLLRPAKIPPPGRDLTLSIPEPSRPASRQQSAAASRPVEPPVPAAKPLLAVPSPAPAPATASIPRRDLKPKPEAKAETRIAKRAAKAAAKAASEAGPEPAATLKDSVPPADRAFILPGIPRPVSKSVTKETSDATKSQKPSEAPAEDEGAARQVREQFDFCSQLLAQGAFADHFDTCLCADARAADPYRGRRGFYAGSLAKASSGGRLETKVDILSVKLEETSATVNARWKVRPSDAGREAAEKWRLEDGLWCRAP